MDRKCSPYPLTILLLIAGAALDWKWNAWSNLSLKQDLVHFQGWVQLIPVLGTFDGQGLAPCSWILVFFKACFQTMNISFQMFIFPFKVNCFLAYIAEVGIYLQCRSILSYRLSRKLKNLHVGGWNYLAVLHYYCPAYARKAIPLLTGILIHELDTWIW